MGPLSPRYPVSMTTKRLSFEEGQQRKLEAELTFAVPTNTITAY